MMTNIFDLSPNDLQQQLQAAGQASFRAQQVLKWVYERGVRSFEPMHNLSRNLRQQLGQHFDFRLPQIARIARSQDGTVKFVFAAPRPLPARPSSFFANKGALGGAAAKTEPQKPDLNSLSPLHQAGPSLFWEAVAIPEGDRITLCLSSQVGCNMGCTFCFTGLQKMQLRLSPGQIVGQYLLAQAHLERPITNLVFMGMGEPLDNPDAVFKAIDIFKHDGGLNLSRKKITLSTSGLVDRLPLVTASGVYLAVSLNATTNKLRSQLMPINKKWPLEKLLPACQQYTQASGHKVTFEYVLLQGVTDSLQQARELHQLTSCVPCKINLIPFNPHPGSHFKRPTLEQVHSFQKVLLQKGSQVYVRKTRGDDISAACGQLNPSVQAA